MDSGTISLIAVIIGCVVGIAGWARNSTNDTGAISEWRGEVKGQLNSIQASVTGIRGDLERLDVRMNEHGERIAKVEASAAQAHKRIDRLSEDVKNHHKTREGLEVSE